MAVSRLPYVNLSTSAGDRRAFSQSSPLFLFTSPGGSEGTATLANLNRRQALANQYDFGWLVESGDEITLTLDYQKNNFVGEVDFFVTFLYGKARE